MSRHILDHDVASDLSYRVLQLRARRHELGMQALDSSNQKLYALPSQFVEREHFMADLESVPDSFQGAAPVPAWHWHGRRKGKR